MQNGKNAASSTAKVQKIQSDIDDLNSFIESLKIEEEPVVVPGDITGTGVVSDDDFDKFVEDLLSGNVPATGDAAFASYDANSDGFIDVADLQAIMNMTMGLNPDGSTKGSAPSRMMGESSFDAGSLTLQSQQLENGVTRLMIDLNSTAEYRAFQMDVMLSDGMKVVAENGNMLTIASKDQTTTKHRIVGYGQMTNGNVLTIDVEGQGNIAFDNVIFSTIDAKSVKFQLGGTTGINAVNEANQNSNIFYDLGGKMMKGLKKGLNIIRSNDGTTKKVVK